MDSAYRCDICGEWTLENAVDDNEMSLVACLECVQDAHRMARVPLEDEEE